MKHLNLVDAQLVSGGDFGTDVNATVPSGSPTNTFANALGAFLVSGDPTTIANSILDNTADWQAMQLNTFVVGNFVIMPNP